MNSRVGIMNKWLYETLSPKSPISKGLMLLSRIRNKEFSDDDDGEEASNDKDSAPPKSSEFKGKQPKKKKSIHPSLIDDRLKNISEDRLKGYGLKEKDLRDAIMHNLKAKNHSKKAKKNK